MELIKRDEVAAAETIAVGIEGDYRELSELELDLIGGGHGDVSFGKATC